MPKTQPVEWLLARESFLLAAVWIALASPMLLAQNNAAPGAAPSPTPTTDATPAPAFDVATIKPHDKGVIRGMGLRYLPDGVNGTVSLQMLVSNAYDLRTPDQVSGGPDWVKNDSFDVQAKMGAADAAAMDKLSNEGKIALCERMLQTLLAERFKLKVHSETKMVPVYEMVLAKGASKLIDSATDTNPKLDRGKDGKPLMGIQSMRVTSIVEGYSMTEWAGFLSQPVAGVGRPVLDKTGLTGTYDFPINWSVYSAGAGGHSGVRRGQYSFDLRGAERDWIATASSYRADRYNRHRPRREAYARLADA